MQLRRPARTILAPLTVLAVVTGTAPALATAKPVASHVSAHLAPSTAHVGSVVALTGATTPRIVSSPVTLERLVGRSWRVLGHGRTSRTGTYAFALRAPGKPAGWTLRVMRGASKTAKPAASARVHLTVVKAVYVVSAAVTATTSAQPVIVTGTVRPKASGSVELQVRRGRTWVNLAAGKLTKTSSYAIRVTRAVGSYRLRVVKAFSAKVAGGTGKVLTATVTAPVVAPPVVAPPVITTTALTGAMVSRPYSLTLTATGGTAPYTWTAAGLPAGLVLSAAGVVSGTPTTVGASTVVVTVTDSQARTATASLPLAVAVLSGTVRVWGSGTSGQLGNGTSANSPVPVTPTGLTLVTAVAGGTYDNFALRTDGTVWAWGENAFGELGIGSTSTGSNVPVQVHGLSGVTAIAGGSESAYALKSDGTVWAWGDDTDGELGTGSAETGTPVTTPVQVSGLTGIIAIAATDSNGLALKSDGTVYAWGDHTSDVLGNGVTATDVTTPAKITSLAGVTAIAGGASSAYALIQGGAVKAWGQNSHGQVGNGSTSPVSTPVSIDLGHIVALSAGYFTGYALHSDGSLNAWGDNTDGELGTGTGPNQLTPVSIDAISGTVTAIEGRGSDCSALLADGSVVNWGNNGYGGLGTGNLTDSPTPVAVAGLPYVIGLGTGGVSISGVAIVATQ